DEIVREQVVRILGDRGGGESPGLGVVVALHGGDGLAIERERGIVAERRRVPLCSARDRQRRREGGDEHPESHGVTSEKRTGIVPQTFPASAPRRAGSKRQLLTLSTAAWSSSALPAERSTRT